MSPGSGAPIPRLILSPTTTAATPSASSFCVLCGCCSLHRCRMWTNVQGQRAPLPDRAQQPGPAETRSLYSRSLKTPALQLLPKSSKSASTTPRRPIWNSSATLGSAGFFRERLQEYVSFLSQMIAWAEGPTPRTRAPPADSDLGQGRRCCGPQKHFQLHPTAYCYSKESKLPVGHHECGLSWDGRGSGRISPAPVGRREARHVGR